MKLQALRKELKELLKQTSPISYSKDIDTLLAHTLNIPKNNILLSDLFINEASVEKLNHEVNRLVQGEPLAYVIGYVDFFGCKFFVSKEVLIPRQETELLVEHIAKDLVRKKQTQGTLWDICAGSGCIGISLKKKFPDLKVILSDLSESALQIAKKNAELNHVDVTFFQGDMLSPFEGHLANFIVSNPPYVSQEAYETLDLSVKNFEPKLALVAKDNGLDFYQKFAESASRFLEPDGILWLEIGYDQGDQLKLLFKYIQILQDLSGHDRFARVEFP